MMDEVLEVHRIRCYSLEASLGGCLTAKTITGPTSDANDSSHRVAACAAGTPSLLPDAIPYVRVHACYPLLGVQHQ